MIKDLPYVRASGGVSRLGKFLIQLTNQFGVFYLQSINPEESGFLICEARFKL